jgi:hypothetical protein
MGGLDPNMVLAMMAVAHIPKINQLYHFAMA